MNVPILLSTSGIELQGQPQVRKIYCIYNELIKLGIKSAERDRKSELEIPICCRIRQILELFLADSILRQQLMQLSDAYSGRFGGALDTSAMESEQLHEVMSFHLLDAATAYLGKADGILGGKAGQVRVSRKKLGGEAVRRQNR